MKRHPQLVAAADRLTANAAFMDGGGYTPAEMLQMVGIVRDWRQATGPDLCEVRMELTDLLLARGWYHCLRGDTGASLMRAFKPPDAAVADHERRMRADLGDYLDDRDRE